jgi:large subunit ribosomal protein L29
MSKPRELRELTDDALLHKLAEAKQGLYNLRFRNATGQLDSSAEIPRNRREIARVATVLREREIAAAEALAAEEQR